MTPEAKNDLHLPPPKKKLANHYHSFVKAMEGFPAIPCYPMLSHAIPLILFLVMRHVDHLEPLMARTLHPQSYFHHSAMLLTLNVELLVTQRSCW